MRRKYNEQENEYLRELTLSDHSLKETARLFMERFEGHEMTATQVKTWRANNHCKSHLTGRFEKGHVPANKGKHQPTTGRMAETQFKKGHRPHDYLPVGSITVRHDKNGHDYHWIKVSDPNKWKMLHVKMWEDANGRIPEGYCINFCNGNTMDCRLENMMLVSRAENAVMNFQGIRGYDKESSETARNIARLKMKISERKPVKC